MTNKTKRKVLLWLDDYRNPYEHNWLVFCPLVMPYDVIWVKDYGSFTNWIKQNGLPDAICFDHDLGTVATGYDCALWVVDYCLDHGLNLPMYNVQSANPVGKKNIICLLENYKKHNNQ